MAHAPNDPDDVLHILSAGAPKAGLLPCADAWTSAGNPEISFRFLTAPRLRAALDGATDEAAGARALIAPEGLLDACTARGLIVANTGTRIGGIRTAPFVRADAPVPEVSTAERLREALLAAPAIVFNRASSGQYIERLLEQLGIGDAVHERVQRTDTGAAAIETIASGAPAGAIGFGQLTEIRRLRDAGVVPAGALPDALQNVTVYCAGVLAGSAERHAATAFLAFLASPQARALLDAAGIER